MVADARVRHRVKPCRRASDRGHLRTKHELAQNRELASTLGAELRVEFLRQPLVTRDEAA